METTYFVEGADRVNRSYFPPPYSINPLSHDLLVGLYPVGALALLSFFSTLALLCFLLYRMVLWRRYYQTFIGSNQYVVLVLNLLFADLQQSSAFLISFHWIRRNHILAPTPACFAQGWLLHSGDVASGFFVLAIAVHTFCTAVVGRRVENLTFYVGIGGIWLFAYFLTFLGVAMHGNKYFVRAGAWCWVSSEFEGNRLALHYIWIFVIEFGTIILYLVTFYQLRRKTSQLFVGQYNGSEAPNIKTIETVNRITKLMMLYPCVYVVLTLPLSAGRMWTMAHGGESVSNAFACTAGALLTSCGWVDTLLYTLTRKRLLRETMPGGSAARKSRAGLSDSGSKGITHTRTVTVRESEAPYTGQPVVSAGAIAPPSLLKRYDALGHISERNPSPTGSLDPILSGKLRGVYKAETTVGLTEMMAEDNSEDSKLEAFELEHMGRVPR